MIDRIASGPTSPGRTSWLATVAVLAAVLLAACAGGSATPAAPAAVQTPLPTLSPVVASTRQAVAAALQARGLSLVDAATTVRPPEPPGFAGSPRWPFRVPLTNDPTTGLIVVYQFASAGAAAEAGAEMAAYLNAGPGRVQYPADVQFTLRQVGSTLVLYTYSPVGSSDPREATIAAALATVGTGITVGG